MHLALTALPPVEDVIMPLTSMAKALISTGQLFAYTAIGTAPANSARANPPLMQISLRGRGREGEGGEGRGREGGRVCEGG